MSKKTFLFPLNHQISCILLKYIHARLRNLSVLYKKCNFKNISYLREKLSWGCWSRWTLCPGSPCRSRDSGPSWYRLGQEAESRTAHSDWSLVNHSCLDPFYSNLYERGGKFHYHINILLAYISHNYNSTYIINRCMN